jgi:hypothetical protein
MFPERRAKFFIVEDRDHLTDEFIAYEQAYLKRRKWSVSFQANRPWQLSSFYAGHKLTYYYGPL